jgi:hypothetical protein
MTSSHGRCVERGRNTEFGEISDYHSRRCEIQTIRSIVAQLHSGEQIGRASRYFPSSRKTNISVVGRLSRKNVPLREDANRYLIFYQHGPSSIAIAEILIAILAV